MSDVYRQRLARMAGGGGDSKSSSAPASTTRRTRPMPRGETTIARPTGDASVLASSRGPSYPSSTTSSYHVPLEYKQMRSDMTSFASSPTVSARSDAAALQNDLAQRFNLSNAVRPTQKVEMSLIADVLLEYLLVQ